ncbi:MAG: hypothetical protein DRJ50_06245 [Actinobacteria bacterium]|nr:MAG: hypothetical protein DRJ50_06245 [Actinomycetota bacterium]
MPILAYLDPATGTLIVAAIVGGFAAGGLWLRRSWYSVKSVFTGSKKTDQQTATDPDLDEAQA